MTAEFLAVRRRQFFVFFFPGLVLFYAAHPTSQVFLFIFMCEGWGDKFREGVGALEAIVAGVRYLSWMLN